MDRHLFCRWFITVPLSVYAVCVLTSSPVSSPLSGSSAGGPAWGGNVVVVSWEAEIGILTVSAGDDKDMMTFFVWAFECFMSSAALKRWCNVHLLILNCCRVRIFLFLTVCTVLQTSGGPCRRGEVVVELVGQWPVLPLPLVDTMTELSSDAEDTTFPDLVLLIWVFWLSLVIFWLHSRFVLLVLQASAEPGGEHPLYSSTNSLWVARGRIRCLWRHLLKISRVKSKEEHERNKNKIKLNADVKKCFLQC